MILGVIIRYAIVTFLINYVEISFSRFLILWFAKPSKYQQLRVHSQRELQRFKHRKELWFSIGFLAYSVKSTIFLATKRKDSVHCTWTTGDRYVAKSINLDINQLYVSDRFDNSRRDACNFDPYSWKDSFM